MGVGVDGLQAEPSAVGSQPTISPPGGPLLVLLATLLAPAPLVLEGAPPLLARNIPPGPPLELLQAKSQVNAPTHNPLSRMTRQSMCVRYSQAGFAQGFCGRLSRFESALL
jgi:hypothetical protein